MWYVVDSEPGSYLYCGLSRDASKEEILERINNNTITDILNKIEVKAGDVVMVKAGTIHAIGAGVFICETEGMYYNLLYRSYNLVQGLHIRNQSHQSSQSSRCKRQYLYCRHCSLQWSLQKECSAFHAWS